MIVGVLGLQGAVREHVRSLGRLNVDVRVVKRLTDLDGLDALILPGGESTTISLLAENGILERLRDMASEGFPLFGTCAGMILLAAEAEGRDRPGIDAIDIAVARNASGRQVDSFETTLEVDGIGNDIPGVFIRAPYVTRLGERVRPMAHHDGFVVMAREGKVLVASFHPELTEDLRIHKYFIDEVVDRGKEDGR
jgi:5'-phosphate synthase pdxT subunit